MAKKDYYEILGVSKNSSADEIKKAYRKLAHQHHPDKTGGSEERFKEINEAYSILSDEKKRAQYDRFGSAFSERGGFGQNAQGFQWPGGGGFEFHFGSGENQEFDFSDILEGVFGFGAGSRGGAKAHMRKGKDIRIDLEIPFEESIFGGKRILELRKLTRCSHCGGTGGEPGTKMKSCAACNGQGRIQRTRQSILGGSFVEVATCPDCFGKGERPEDACKECRGKRVIYGTEHIQLIIPKGVREQMILKVTGKGEASQTGGVPGDLYVRLEILPHKVFQRRENDLIMVLSIKLSDAVLGGNISVATLDGEIKVKIPEGTQSGDILKVRGRGVPSEDGYGRGNLLIEIKVEMPKRLSRKAKDAIQSLKDEGL